MKYVDENLLPSLKPGQPIVIDNASYHTVTTDDTKSPTSSNKKQEIIDWLEEKGEKHNTMYTNTN